MTIPRYVDINQRTHVFDGAQARHHLNRRLGITMMDPGSPGAPMRDLARWIEHGLGAILVHPSGPKVLVPGARRPQDN